MSNLMDVSVVGDKLSLADQILLNLSRYDEMDEFEFDDSLDLLSRLSSEHIFLKKDLMEIVLGESESSDRREYAFLALKQIGCLSQDEELSVERAMHKSKTLLGKYLHLTDALFRVRRSF